MQRFFENSIPFLFSMLFFLTPFLFFHRSSELFEFNKMVAVWTFTILIVGVWLLKMVHHKKFIFKKTFLDIPLLALLISQLVSTVFSIDQSTSIFGYYSRHNGGLLSILSYSLLYWAYVSNVNAKVTIKLLNSILVSGLVISIWASLEHFGKSPSCLLITSQFDANCWVQDVKHRVFATMGQPNWLAAWIVALMPIAWALILNFKVKSRRLFIFHLINILFFSTLLFTKSRSGILGFVASYILFWGISFINLKKKLFKQGALVFCYFLLIASLVGTPWTPSLTKVNQNPTDITTTQGPALETGGTESGKLRQIVWKGAVDIWRAYPIFGTGVETFAYSYYQFRPIEHNNTSEWDFLYNKAHNEYLNQAANTGTVGLVSYFVFIFSSILIFINPTLSFSMVRKLKMGQIKRLLSLNKHFSKIDTLELGFLSSFFSLLVTNFFGFSVVSTNLLLFLLPAMAISLGSRENSLENKTKKHLSIFSVASSLFAIGFILYLLFNVAKYWYADILFAQGRSLYERGIFDESAKNFSFALKLTPHNALFHDELAAAYAQIALLMEKQNESTTSAKVAIMAENELILVEELSPRNVNLAKSRSNIYFDLSQIDEVYLAKSIEVMHKLETLAPTDPQVFQKLGFSYAIAGSNTQAVKYLLKAIELKPDFKRARQALAYIYRQEKNYDGAYQELEYILKNISPDDELVRSELEELATISAKKAK